MANKSFGTKQLDLTGASGSPIITSPSDLSINATTVAISTNISVGGYFGSNVNVGTGYSIGIGTTIPVSELEVKGDIGLSGNLNIGDNGISNPFTYLRFGASQYGAADIRPTNEASHKIGLAFYVDGTQDTTINPTEALRITSSGDVGIGSTGGVEDLAHKLFVRSTDGAIARFERTDGEWAKVDIKAGTNTGNSYLTFSDTDESEVGKINYEHNDNSLRFDTNSGEKLRITSSGAIGVGATAWEGTTGQVLTSQGWTHSPTWRHTNTPMWFGTPADNTQTTTSSDWTTVTNLTDNVIDKGNGGWNSTTGVFTVQSGDAGIYWVYGVTGIDDVQEGNQVRTGFSKNGAVPPVWAENRNPHNADQICTSGMYSQTVSLAEGDTIKMQTYHNEGTNNETVRANRTLFGGYRLSA